MLMIGADGVAGMSVRPSSIANACSRRLKNDGRVDVDVETFPGR